MTYFRSGQIADAKIRCIAYVHAVKHETAYMQFIRTFTNEKSVRMCQFQCLKCGFVTKVPLNKRGFISPVWSE